MQTLLSLNNVGYQHRSQALLSGLTFDINPHEIIGLLGINGAGKSTTLQLLAGTLLPNHGKIQRAKSLRVGYLSDKLPLIPHWSVKQTLKHGCRLHAIPSAQHNQHIDNAMQQCDITDIAKQPVGQLSKGNRQRVGLALAIIHRPTLLILDEPTSGLDPRQLNRFRHLITTLKSQTAVVFSSHTLTEIEAVCDRIIVIHQGQQAGEITLANHVHTENHVAITFTTAFSSTDFVNYTQWQRGDGDTHYFRLSNPNDQNRLLRQLIDDGRSVMQIQPSKNAIEQEFFRLIKPMNQ